MRVKRLSSIGSGLYTTVIVDGSVRYLKGRENTKGRYLFFKKRKYYEDQLPIGEEVEI